MRSNEGKTFLYILIRCTCLQKLRKCYSGLVRQRTDINDLTIGWQNLNLLSHPKSTLAPQARQAKASGKILNYSLSHYSDILK